MAIYGYLRVSSDEQDVNNQKSGVVDFAAQIERDMISMRTTEALVVRKREGVLLGAPRNLQKIVRVSDEIMGQMEQMAEGGTSLTKIAGKFNLHRITVGYYLAKSKTFKGILAGYNISYYNGKVIFLTKKNCIEYGLYYKHIQEAYKSGKDMSFIGIQTIEPNFRISSKEYERDNFTKSEHEKIDRNYIERLILSDMTIPEIHNRIGEEVSYTEVYDYISGDTYLSNEYRLKGQLRCKSKRVRG
jgi:hypothetical protein